MGGEEGATPEEAVLQVLVMLDRFSPALATGGPWGGRGVASRPERRPL